MDLAPKYKHCGASGVQNYNNVKTIVILGNPCFGGTEISARNTIVLVSLYAPVHSLTSVKLSILQ